MPSDNQLQQDVLAELRWEPSVTSAHIGVTVKGGVIALTGHVESYAEKCAAETATRRVKGIKAVAEELEVRLPYTINRGDDEIAAAAIERLAWDVSIPPESIQVKVEQGWLTLTGQVEWHYQHAAAENDVCALFGVIGVSNQITIKPKVDVSNLSDTIMHALHRSWFFDPKTIQVNAEGGKIRLTGSVNSFHDRERAEAAAWAAPGATSVENNIAIT